MAVASKNKKSAAPSPVNKKSKPAPRPEPVDKPKPRSHSRPVVIDMLPEDYASIPPRKKLKQLTPMQQRLRDSKELGSLNPNGRPKGVPNKTTTLLKVIAIGAIERLGYDGKGKDGATGWMMRQARFNPDEYLKFLGKLLPLQVNVADNTPKVYESLEEIVEGFKRRGLPIPPNLMKTVRPNGEGEEQPDPDEGVDLSQTPEDYD